MFEIWDEFDGVLEITGPISYMLRSLGWEVLRLLAFFVDGIERVTDDIISINGFFSSPEVTSFIDQYQPFVWVLFAISIVIIGYQLIFNRKQNREQLPTNVLFSIAVLVLLSTMMVKINDLSIAAVDSVNTTETQTVAKQVIKENLTDVYLLDQTGFADKSIRNNIPVDNILKINIVEEIDPKKVNNEALKKKEGQSVNGEPQVEELENGFFSMWKEYYYRWGWDFWNIFISLGVVGVALLITSVKLGRILFELAFKKFFATIVAAIDVSNGQRTKQILMSILSDFAVVFFIVVLLRLYIIFSGWLSLNTSGMLHIILLLSASWALIDGPNIVERVLGVDAGLQSGWKALASTYMLAKGAKGALSAGGKVLQGGAAGAAAMGGMAKGRFDSNSSGTGANAKNEGQGDQGEKGTTSSQGNNGNNSSIPLSTEMKGHSNSNREVSSIHNRNESVGSGNSISTSDTAGHHGTTSYSGEMNDQVSGSRSIHHQPTYSGERGSDASGITPRTDGTRESRQDAQQNNTPPSHGGNNSQSMPGASDQAGTKPSDSQIYEAMNTVANADQGETKGNSAEKTIPTGSNNQTIGGYMNERFNRIPLVRDVKKGYSLGYNTGQQRREKVENRISQQMEEGRKHAQSMNQDKKGDE